jgi:hypothetical protein
MVNLSATLRQLELEIQRKLPAWLTGRPTKDEDAERRDTEIEDYLFRLGLLIRDLKSQEILLRVQQQRMARTPPRNLASGAMWAQGQRIQGIEALKKQADELARLVNDMFKRNGLNPMQAADKIHELVENMSGSFAPSDLEQARQAGQHLQAAITAPPNVPHPGDINAMHSFDTAVPVLMFVCVLLKSIQNKAQKGKAKHV